MCNCQKGLKEFECLTSAVVYIDTVTSDCDVRMYTGSTDRKFKERLYEQRTDANNRSHIHNTKLTGYTWEMKDAKVDIDIVAISEKHVTDMNQVGGCERGVCLSETFSIMKNREHNSLSQKSELVHR